MNKWYTNPTVSDENSTRVHAGTQLFRMGGYKAQGMRVMVKPTGS